MHRLHYTNMTHMILGLELLSLGTVRHSVFCDPLYIPIQRLALAGNLRHSFDVTQINLNPL